MIEQCRAQGAPEPEFVQVRNNKEFRSILPRDVLTESVLVKAGLSERQMRAIKLIKENGQITNNDYQKMSGVSKATATRDLMDLLKRGILERFGVTGRGTAYHLSGKGLIKGSKGS
jgi:ATP-dependent DNA helicase RecG